MPVGFGKVATSKGRSLSVLAHFNKSIEKVKAKKMCLAHVLVNAIARVANDPNYKL